MTTAEAVGGSPLPRPLRGVKVPDGREIRGAGLGYRCEPNKTSSKSLRRWNEGSRTCGNFKGERPSALPRMPCLKRRADRLNAERDIGASARPSILEISPCLSGDRSWRHGYRRCGQPTTTGSHFTPITTSLAIAAQPDHKRQRCEMPARASGTDRTRSKEDGCVEKVPTADQKHVDKENFQLGTECLRLPSVKTIAESSKAGSLTSSSPFNRHGLAAETDVTRRRAQKTQRSLVHPPVTAKSSPAPLAQYGTSHASSCQTSALRQFKSPPSIPSTPHRATQTPVGRRHQESDTRPRQPGGAQNSRLAVHLPNLSAFASLGGGGGTVAEHQRSMTGVWADVESALDSPAGSGSRNAVRPFTRPRRQTVSERPKKSSGVRRRVRSDSSRPPPAIPTNERPDSPTDSPTSLV